MELIILILSILYLIGCVAWWILMTGDENFENPKTSPKSWLRYCFSAPTILLGIMSIVSVLIITAVYLFNLIRGQKYNSNQFFLYLSILILLFGI